MSETFTLSQLLDVLQDLIQKQQSGSLFITSEDGHFGTLGLDAGEIVSVMYAPKRGVAALPLIAGLQRGSYRFDPAAVAGRPQELPTTQQILEMLRSGSPAGVVTGAVAAPTRGISETEKNFACNRLKELLAQHLGPIADIVMDDALEDAGDICANPAQMPALVDKLAAEIDSESEAAEFRAAAEKTIAKLVFR